VIRATDFLRTTQEAIVPELSSHQKLVAVAVAVAMMAFVLELVRRRKLREEYSFLWIATAVVLLALAMEPRLLTWFRGLIDAKTGPSGLFFGALVFLMAVSLMMSIRLSRLTFRSKALTQQAALLQREVDELRQDLAKLRRDAAKSVSENVPRDGVA